MPPALVQWYVETLQKQRPLRPEEEGSYNAAPPDSRFPNQNITRYCYQMYLDYHRCVKKHGESYEPCNYFNKNYKILCPTAWIEKWDDQIANDVFPGNI